MRTRARLEIPQNLILPRKTASSVLIPCLYLTADIYLYQIPPCTLCRRRNKPCIRYARSASGVCEACHFGKVKCSRTVLTHMKPAKKSTKRDIQLHAKRSKATPSPPPPPAEAPYHTISAIGLNPSSSFVDPIRDADGAEPKMNDKILEVLEGIKDINRRLDGIATVTTSLDQLRNKVDVLMQWAEAERCHRAGFITTRPLLTNHPNWNAITAPAKVGSTEAHMGEKMTIPGTLSISTATTSSSIRSLPPPFVSSSLTTHQTPLAEESTTDSDSGMFDAAVPHFEDGENNTVGH
jgi:hypothetical protein